MDPLELRPLGRTDLHVTRLGFGGAPLGDRLDPVSEPQAQATIEAAYAAGIRLFDTSPFYGNGKSEHRLGHALRSKPRDSFVLTTKIGRLFSRPKDVPAYQQRRQGDELPFEFRFDYTREGVFRSYEDSLHRLSLNTVDALLIHDLDVGAHGSEEAVQNGLRQLEEGGGFAALQELKRNGEIQAIGSGVNRLGTILPFLERFDLDFFIVAMPYTLLCQDALAQELPAIQERGVSVVIGAVFSSGILAIGPQSGARYGYRPAETPIMEKAQRIDAVCRRYNVPLGAAALQFPLGHPSVAAVIPGPNAPEQVARNLEWLRLEIPSDLWAELKAEGLLHPEAPTP